jgi:hypothetical protein
MPAQRYALCGHPAFKKQLRLLAVDERVGGGGVVPRFHCALRRAIGAIVSG